MDKKHVYIQKINRVIDYIELNLQNKINLETLSQVACLSKFHFNRIFYSFTNESLYNFINRLRLERAALLLSQTKSIITEVAFSCGFNDSATFSRAFKQFFKITPSNWRKNNSKIHQALKNKSLYTYNDRKKSLLNVQARSVEVKLLQSTTIAYVRNTGPYSGDSKLFYSLNKKLINWAKTNDIVDYIKANIVIIYHDPIEITSSDKLRISFGFTFENTVKPKGEIGRMLIPKGKYIICRYYLDNNQYPQAWANVYRDLMPQRGLQPKDGYCFERYAYDCYNKKDKKTIVDICVPVKRI